MTVNNTIAKNNYFGFKVIDFDGFMPSVTAKYTSLLDDVPATCVIDPNYDPKFTLDDAQNTIQMVANWNCSLIYVDKKVANETETDTLLVFNVLNNYTLTAKQVND